MQNTFAIRDIRSGDREEFVEMAFDFYNSSATLCEKPREHFEIIFDLSVAINPFLRGLIIESNGATAGYAHLSFTHSNEVAGMVLLIEEIYIKPEFQGQGLGSSALAWLFEEYRGKIKRYRLEVTNVNDGAIKLYERLGFAKLNYLQMVIDE